MSWEFWVSMIPSILVVIGGGFSFFKFKKEFNKIKQAYKSSINIEINNHRQEWIDSFRDDIAKYFDYVTSMINSDVIEQNKLNEYYASHYTLLLRLNINNEIDRLIESKLEEFGFNFKLYSNLLEKEYSVYDFEQICSNKISFIKLNNAAYRDTKDKQKTFENMYMIDENEEGEEIRITYVDDETFDKAESSYKLSEKQLNSFYKKELKYKLQQNRNNLLILFRIYLKVEWERVKVAITENKNIDFNLKFKEIYKDLDVKILEEKNI